MPTEPDTVDPADVGRRMRQEHGWAKAQLLILYAVLESLWQADSWTKRGKFAFWFGIYGTIAVVAVAYSLIAYPLRKLWTALKWTVRLTRMGFEKLIREPSYLFTSAARDIPKLPRVGYLLAKNTIGKLWSWIMWIWTQISGLWESTVEYFTGFGINDTLPPWIVSNISWIIGLIPRSFGVRDTTRREQINANIVILIAMALSALFPLTSWTLAFAFIPLAMLFIAFFFRGTPAGESYWRRFRRSLPIESDYDIPGWRGE